MLYIEVMYHFNEQVDFKISSKLIQASKGYKHDILNNISLIHPLMLVVIKIQKYVY